MDKNKKSQCKCKENCDCQTPAEDLNYQTNLEEKVLEYVQTAQRLQAEFDNYRKNAQMQIAEARYNGMADAITKLMPVLDGIAAAKKMVTDENLLQ